MSNLSPDTRLQRSETVLQSNLGAKSVMMDLDAGLYFGLNDVASRIWNLLEQPRTVTEIVSKLVAEYEIDPAECEPKVLAFADELITQHLVSPAPSDA